MTTRFKISLLGSLLGLLFIGPPVHSQVYKWHDERGNVHYTQTPPMDTKVEVIKPNVPKSALVQAKPLQPQAKPAQAQDQQPPPEQSAEGKSTEPKPKPSEQEVAQLRKSNCEKARKNLETLHSHGRIRLRDGTVLSEQQRQAKIAEAQHHIEQYCT